MRRSYCVNVLNVDIKLVSIIVCMIMVHDWRLVELYYHSLTR